MKLIIVSLLFLAAPVVFCAETNQVAQAQSDADGHIQRGKYLVERVAMCADCHTPRDNQGQYDRAHWLQGNILEFQPAHPMPFTSIAPPIAGLPTYATDDLAVKFFETGQTATGKFARPPMPQFRFSHDDAVAVVAYLRSVKVAD